MNARIVVFLCLATLGLGSSALADADGDALAKRFLAHMDSIAPVAGTFTVETRFDPEVRAADLKSKDEWAASQGFKLRHGPEEPLLSCEWAWDGTRESLKTLEGSNKFDQFYLTPEAFIEGMAPDNYNLNNPARPGAWRPASFYLLGGAVPWSTYLSDFRFSRENAPENAPANSVVLVCKSSRKEVRLLIDEVTGMMHGYERITEGNHHVQLIIDRFEQATDGRVFPSLARLTVHLNGQPYRIMTLTAERITFRPAEVAEAMQLVLPSGTKVHDRVLNRVIPITRPTPVEEVLAGQIATERPSEHPLAESVPTPAQTTVDLPSSGPASRRLGWIIGGIAALAAVGVWSLLKGGRMWNRARP